MATPPTPGQPLQLQLTYRDRPEISETYADSLGRVFFDGITLRMEFVVNRMDDPQPPNPPTGKAVTAARVVIPLPGMMDMVAKLQTLVQQMQTQGMLRHVHPPSGDQRPN